MWRITKTTTKPAAMKDKVATIDRAENRAMPQIPCPLVQPEPRRVPNPTTSPPNTVSNAPPLGALGTGMSKKACAATAAQQ